MKIISGGQTGVDRAGLDASLESDIECGGWCPEGRAAEDGVIPDKYPVNVLPGAGYRQRTKKNVLDSDGTVIIYFDYPTGGTELTISFCINEHKPYVLIDAEEISVNRAAQKILEFAKVKDILNIAGPRAGGESRAYDYTKAVMMLVLSQYNKNKPKRIFLTKDQKSLNQAILKKVVEAGNELDEDEPKLIMPKVIK